jgi:hypothetical protein
MEKVWIIPSSSLVPYKIGYVNQIVIKFTPNPDPEIKSRQRMWYVFYTALPPRKSQT